jgi:hypothetical protein
MTRSLENEAEDDTQERRHQARVTIEVTAIRARRWVGGAWRDLQAEVVDLSSRGLGLRLDQEVHVGDRLSLHIPLDDGQPDLRVTVEVRHIRAGAQPGEWRAGGLFRTLSAADHDRVVDFVFAELEARLRL